MTVRLRLRGYPNVLASFPLHRLWDHFSLFEIFEALDCSHPFFFQLYVNRNRRKVTRILDEARRLGARAIMVMSDLRAISKRESVKESSTLTLISKDHELEVNTSGLGSGSLLSSELVRQATHPPVNNVIDPDLNWADIQWVARHTGLPVFVKRYSAGARCQGGCGHRMCGHLSLESWRTGPGHRTARASRAS
ncbi:uncharacterized protein A1O5_08318 [Cladophialophora psammophila CBS 110553]|uniref:FMN-dependent dehydrogenase domain-containing protein n=1 Tax=Cladophialophora psammophila CBS 110553 TaxID=1182543 RepID=W9WU20_9EURO|nr:uncharacterized protein A1O5_08318 [Cladophialophora psammophila CBS 110553]EXJ68525.1 hypothetical protein A1O5_08318 [Cladophialophora psammophila CBS 110553]